MGFKGEALNISCPLMGGQSPPRMTNVSNSRKLSGGQSPPLRKNKCWASPKGVSLSAESDKGVALDLRAFEKARAKLLIV